MSVFFIDESERVYPKQAHAERKKGCDFCLRGKPLNGETDVGKIKIFKRTLYTTYSNEFYDMETSISFCPICGRGLEVQNARNKI